MLEQALGAVRYAFATACTQVDYLNRIPFLAARLDEPGIKDRCIHQFESCSWELHDRVSLELFHPAGVLRAHVDNITPDGKNISIVLQAEIDGLANIPMNDGIGEGLHPIAKSVHDHAPGSKWVWVVASSRIKQNIDQSYRFPAELGVDFDVVWRNWKSLLQVSGEGVRLGRNRRISTNKFLRRVYFLDDGFEADHGGDGDGEDDDGENRCCGWGLGG